MQEDFFEDAAKVEEFANVISKPRLTKYLPATGGELSQSLQLYQWNSQLSQALYLPLQTWEILTRNKLNDFFRYKYDDKWPWNLAARRNFNSHDTRRLLETVERMERDLAPSSPTTDQIVADLTAGFWVSQFGKNYQAQYGWKSNLRFRIFVKNHEITRDDAEAICNELLDLRNRVAHHEPIFHLELGELKKDMDWLIDGMCEVSGVYLASTDTFAHLWANPPAGYQTTD